MTVAARGNQGAAGGWSGSTTKKAGADVASTTVTATGTGTPFAVEDAVQIDAQVNVTAETGTTPSFTLTLQTSLDGTNYYNVGSFTAITAAGSAQQSFGGNLGVLARWSWVVSGTTPSITFNVDTQARTSRI
jgi:hypothetical protein